MGDGATNGPQAADQDPAGGPGNERLQDVGRRLGRFLASATARVREEAEDILAEAQSIRRGERE